MGMLSSSRRQHGPVDSPARRFAARSGAIPAAIASLLLPAAAPGQEVFLVATRSLAPAPYDLTLPEKVGLLEAGEHRALAFEVSGRLAELAGEGERVAAGGGVAGLDAALERAQLRQAQLRLREARSDLERVRGLSESGAASEKGLESAETAAELRLAERDAARERLARRSIIAPFDGVVVESYFDPGEVVSPGAAVVDFMDLSTLRLELGVPGYQVGRVAQGARVFVTGPALPGRTFEGVVHRVAPAAAEGRHLFEVEIRVGNSGGDLRPGMSVRARIVAESLASALVVPLQSSVQRDGTRIVFFVDDGHARAVHVDDAPLQGDRLVLSGDLPYRELVLRGQRNLRDGVPVRVDNTVLEGAPRDGGAQADVRVGDAP